jgi:NAD+ kinase
VDTAAALDARGVRVVAVKGDGWTDGGAEVRPPDEFGEGLDLVLAMGGDGTFLRAAYLARDRGVPVLGVNLGRLGFLTEVEATNLDQALQRLVAGDFGVEERMTLSVGVHDADGAEVATAWALNDASVERTLPQRLIVFEVRVNETVLANVPADAVICATPTGSTAYAFSAGGPILSPLVDAILLTPVAPHSLFNRTIVVDPHEALWVRPAAEGECVVSCDGRDSVAVPLGGSVRVSRGELPVRMVRLGPFDFYQRVRDKFGLR